MSNALTYGADQGLTAAASSANTQETGVKPGEVYEFSATVPTLVRWGTDAASAADGTFDFCVPVDTPIRRRVPNGISSFFTKRGTAAASGTLFLSLVQEVV